jgi:hypothetical protein
VHEQAELQVLPLVDVLAHERIGILDVRGPGVLRRGGESQPADERRRQDAAQQRACSRHEGHL